MSIAIVNGRKYIQKYYADEIRVQPSLMFLADSNLGSGRILNFVNLGSGLIVASRR
jgi:hypothetical protein